jgi:small conductance mechanosensitive channel
VDANIASLERLISIMEPLELPVSSYRTLVVQSTNDLSRGLEVSALRELGRRGWESLKSWTMSSLPSLLVKAFIFLLIVYLFWLVSKVIERIVQRAVNSSKIGFSHLLRNMIISLAGKLFILLGITLALSQVGVSVGPMIAGLGVAGFILGFALQETLGNFAAGLMILFYRPFDEGDMVEAAGVFGKVSKMSLVSTTILTIDNKTLNVPNGKIWGDVICNITNEDMRRVDLVFGVAYDADIPHVEEIIATMVEEHPKILNDPAPTIKVNELGDSSVNFIVRPWVATEDYWNVHWDLTRNLKIKFDEEGIGIPFPQRDVHHYYPEMERKPEVSSEDA